MMEREVSDQLPVGFMPGYGSHPLPEKCWYVRCRSRLAPMTTGGASVLVCVSKRSGRVFRVESVTEE
jgi:hypothetical protein